MRQKEAPRAWGSVARRGARVVGEPPEGSARAAWRQAVATSRAREEWAPEQWVREPEPAEEPPRERPRRRERGVPEEVARDLGGAVGASRAERVQERLGEAVRAYERDRYPEARRLLKALAEQAPDVAAVRELYGLTLYRMGKWRDAIRELEAFRTLTGSYDQHPVLADCYRALRRWRDVEELWEDLRRASPSAEVVAEGRIVAAGALADRGDLREAIRLLEQGRLNVTRPRLHHLRMWYALADLFERAGEIPRARELFRRVVGADRDFVDARERLAALD